MTVNVNVFSPAALLFDYPPWNRHAPAGYARPNTGLMDRVNQLYDELDLAGAKNRAKRDWLWGRLVGAGVKAEDADPVKVQALIAELEKLQAAKKTGKK